MKNGSVLLTTFITFFSVSALAENSGRSLPRGENIPLIVEAVYEAPQGEVQILKTQEGNFTAWLRTEQGALLPYRQMNGSSACEAWLGKGANSRTPKGGCEFVFLSDSNEPVRVRTGELKESSLFDLGHPGKRGLNVTL